MTLAHVALGANLGDREAELRRAVRHLAGAGSLRAVSPLYETDAVGGPPQPPYLNAVAMIETGWAPEVLLRHLWAGERQAGRVRRIRWGPRPLDLDLLAWGNGVRRTPALILPHPEAHRRGFVLRPWLDVWPTGRLYGRSLADWEAGVRQPGRVRRVGHPFWWLRLRERWPRVRLHPDLAARLRADGVQWHGDPGLVEVVDGPGITSWDDVARERVRFPPADWSWRLVARTRTTMTAAREALGDAGSRVLVWAESQDAGRGRRGRRWQGLPGQSLLVSFAWKPEPHELSGPLTLLAGVAAVRAVRAVTGVTLTLKWPNDGQLAGEKCLGILAEARSGPDPALILGFGLNVNGDPGAELGFGTSLAHYTGRPWPRVAVAAALAAELSAVLRQWALAGSADPLLKEWERYDRTVGQAVRIVPGDGPGFTGRALAIEPDGQLVVRRDDTGRRAVVAAGDVSLRFD